MTKTNTYKTNKQMHEKIVFPSNMVYMVREIANIFCYLLDDPRNTHVSFKSAQWFLWRCDNKEIPSWSTAAMLVGGPDCFRYFHSSTLRVTF